MPEIAAAVINWNSGARLGAALKALAETPDLEVVVIDNASADGSLGAVRPDRRVRVIANESNRGFAGGVNQAFGATNTPFVLILNPDVRVRPGAVAALRQVFVGRSRAGAAGGFVNRGYPPRPFPTLASLMRENAGLPPVSPGPRGSGILRVDQPAGAALMIRREAFDAVGGFDESFHPVWYEDVDFCRRLADAGWEAYYQPDAVFDHEGGYSMTALGYERFMKIYYRNQLRYARKHLGGRGLAALKVSLAGGLLLRTVARPRRAGGHWRVLWHVLSGE